MTINYTIHAGNMTRIEADAYELGLYDALQHAYPDADISVSVDASTVGSDSIQTSGDADADDIEDLALDVYEETMGRLGTTSLVHVVRVANGRDAYGHELIEACHDGDCGGFDEQFLGSPVEGATDSFGSVPFYEVRDLGAHRVEVVAEVS